MHKHPRPNDDDNNRVDKREKNSALDFIVKKA